MDDVKNGTGDTNRGNHASNFFVARFPGYPYPDGLVPGTTYYWRVDEVQTDGTVQQGTIRNFKIPSNKATNPNPADGTEFVDPDERDDSTHPDSASEGWYKTYMSTPPIDISGAEAGTVQLTFDSSWRPEFDSDYHQSGIITASFNGEEEVELMLWLSDPSSPNFKAENLAHENETVVINVNNPPWATSVVLKFGMFDAGNDWWWAIDNIKVTGIPK